MPTLTKSQIKKKYTRIVKYDSGYATYLQIDHQGFTVVQDTTKKRAEWFAKMLASALHRFAEQNQNDNRA